MAKSLILTYGYTNSDFTRKCIVEGVADSISNSDIKNKVKAINQSLAGGTSDGLDTFFVADDFDGTNGKLAAITKAQVKERDETVLNLNTSEQEGD